MKEQEMWQIVQRILGAGVRKVVLPASMGIGLALASGCGDRTLTTDAGPAQDSRRVDTGAMARYAAPQPDYAAPFPKTDGSEVVLPLYAALQGDAAPFPKKDAG